MLFPLLVLVPRKEVQHVASSNGVYAPLLSQEQREEGDMQSERGNADMTQEPAGEQGSEPTV